MGLTRRDNLLALLSHQRVEHLSAFFVADNFNRPQPLPPGLGEEDALDPRIQRYLGGAVVDRLAISAEVSRESRQTVQTVEMQPDGAVRRTWQTADGALTSLAVPSAEGETTFTVEFPIKRPADWDRLRRVLEDSFIHTDITAIEREGRAHLARVGDDGILYAVGPCTPIMEVTRSWAGLERFVYDLADEPTRVLRVMELMHRLNCEHYEQLCRHTPGRVLVNWDDVNNLYLSRRLLQEHWVPAMGDYAAICHRYGKILVMHTCGKLQGLLDLFPETGIDAIDWLTPPPTGDVTFAEAQRILGDGVAVMGAAEPGVMRFGTPVEVEASLHRWLTGVDLTYNFVLMVPCPLGTPLANAARVSKVLARDYGMPLNSEPGLPPLWQDPAAQWDA